MRRFLLAVDGSETSSRATECFLKQVTWFKEPIELHLINVQPQLPGDVNMLVEKTEIRRFHEERGLAALANSRVRLDAAGVRYVVHVAVSGNFADSIVNYAIAKNCEQIFMGTRGMDAVAGLLFGSVATKVVHLSIVPVLLVK